MCNFRFHSFALNQISVVGRTMHTRTHTACSAMHIELNMNHAVQFQMQSEIQLLLLILLAIDRSIDRFTIASWSMWNGTQQWKSIFTKKNCKRKQCSWISSFELRYTCVTQFNSIVCAMRMCKYGKISVAYVKFEACKSNGTNHKIFKTENKSALNLSNWAQNVRKKERKNEWMKDYIIIEFLLTAIIILPLNLHWIVHWTLGYWTDLQKTWLNDVEIGYGRVLSSQVHWRMENWNRKKIEFPRFTQSTSTARLLTMTFSFESSQLSRFCCIKIQNFFCWPLSIFRLTAKF